jgi:hypothetical protein
MFVDVETRCGKQLADQTGTGLRMGELTGLECKHFDGESVKVEQAVNGAVGKPKRKNAYRVQAA